MDITPLFFAGDGYAFFSDIGRRVSMPFGRHLANTVFRDSLLFPAALTVIGLVVVAAGVFWQRHEVAIGAWIRARLPAPLSRLANRIIAT